MAALNMGEHRPAVVWMTDLQKAKIEGVVGIKPKTTIIDIIERVNASVDADPSTLETQLIPTSPRSVEACLRLGIDPLELAFKPLAYFRRAGEEAELNKLRYEHHEAVRQERLSLLLTERKRLLEENAPARPGLPSSGTKGREKQGDDTSLMIEKEKQRLEVLRRRQEKELQQMLQFEMQRKELIEKQQRKVEAMEKRSQELQRHKEESDAQWAVQQRERELQKMREEEEREREAKVMAQERYRREQELQRKDALEARRRRQEATMREMERRQKTEDARKATESILAAQVEEVRQRKLEMDRRDKERQLRLRLEAEERAVANQVKRQQAELRITSALQSNRDILRKKREDFEHRERLSEDRRRQLEELRRQEDERKRVSEEMKEKERQDKYQAALQQEEMRKECIRRAAEEKDRLLAEVSEQRRRENERRRLEKELHCSLRLDKVDSMRKMQTWQRQTLFEKIMTENERTAQLLEQRQGLQQQRKEANMQASMNRHAINEMMDLMRTGKARRSMEASGGLSLDSLVKRPHTART